MAGYVASPLPRRRGRARRWVPVALAGLLLVAGCSGSDDDSGPSTTDGATTTAAAGSDGSTTTEADGVTTTGDGSGTATTEATDPNAPPTTATVRDGEVALSGDAVGENEEGAVRIVKAPESIRSFEATGLVITCRAMVADEEPFPKTIDVFIADVGIDGDGMVEYVGGPPYNPDLLGSFGPDGSFDGSLYISYEQGDRVCGGEFAFAID